MSEKGSLCNIISEAFALKASKINCGLRDRAQNMLVETVSEGRIARGSNHLLIFIGNTPVASLCPPSTSATASSPPWL